MNNKPALTCWGGVGAVTGANFLFEIENKKYLIDCGLLQGVAGENEVNPNQFDYDPKTIDALFITHGHLDHIGKIPKLVGAGFEGVIYSTPETRSIVEVMLADLEGISGDHEVKISEIMALWQTINYHEPRAFPGFTLELLDSGHILGSAMYKFNFAHKSMLFTGDLGNSPSPILRDTDPVSGLTYLLIESVYGDRNHESVEERDEKFKTIVAESIKRGGTLLIPIFSLERTQVMLYQLKKLFESGALPSVPVFLDSPLAIRVTEIYERVKNLYNQEATAQIKKGKDIFDFPKLKETTQVRDSNEIAEVKGPKIILAGSGMSTAGRILGHETRYLPDTNATILFVGYQAPGTLGRQIMEGVKKVKINNADVEVKARVESIEGFSGHKDSDHLVEFVSQAKDTLKKVFVTMGEPKSSIFLTQRLRDELDVDAIVPERGKRYELDL